MKKEVVNNHGSRNSPNRLRNISIAVALISIAGFWGTGLVNTYFYTPGFKLQYSILLLCSALIATIGCALSIFSSFKTTGGSRYVSVLCALITFCIASLEFISALLTNANIAS
jgi:hypothetical protein